jgi:ATP-grasp domain, R2K clade family 3
MTERTTFLVSTMSRWVADDLEPAILANNLALERDMGLYLPHAQPQEVVGAWLPAAHATRLGLNGYDLKLASPGPRWLDNVDPALTHRRITTSRVKDALPQDGFWKIAEAKSDDFPAQWRTSEQCHEDFAQLPPDSWVQYSDTFLDIESESRFFVSQHGSDFQIAGSVYATPSWTYYDDLLERHDPEAEEFVKSLLSDFSRFSPLGYVLDVARLSSGDFAVLETNPAWCSGVYASDTEQVVRSIMMSMSDDNTQYAWEPDAFLIRSAQNKRPLPKRG